MYTCLSTVEQISVHSIGFVAKCVSTWGAGGESAHLPPMCPGFDSQTRRHMWAEFVVGSLICSERFFSRNSGLPLSSKTNTYFDLILFL